MIALLVGCFAVQAQKNLGEYKASNGITYKKGDTIKLGHGSMPNGDFKYVEIGGWASVGEYDQKKTSDHNNLNKKYSGLSVVVKKVQSQKWKDTEKVSFIVSGENITNYYLHIEDAIQSCEIADCKKASTAAPEK